MNIENLSLFACLHTQIRQADCPTHLYKVRVQRLTKRIKPGVVFMTFHFPETAVNLLTIASLDPVAKIPEYKATAVKVARVE